MENIEKSNSWSYLKGLFIEKISGAHPPKESTSAEWTSVSGLIPKEEIPKTDSYPEEDHAPNQEVVIAFSKKVQHCRRQEEIAEDLILTIDQLVDFDHIAVVFNDKLTGDGHIVRSKGYPGRRIPVGFIRIPAYDAISRIFKGELASNRKGPPLLLRSGELAKMIREFPDNKQSELGLIKAAHQLLAALNVSVCVPLTLKDHLCGMILIGNKTNGQEYFSEETFFFSMLAQSAVFAIEQLTLKRENGDITEQVQSNKKLSEGRMRDVAIALACAVEAKDPITYAHLQRVSLYAGIILREMGNHPDIVKIDNVHQTLRLAALLHDIGKIGVSDYILTKPGRLTEAEYKAVRRYPAIGNSILKPLKDFEAVREAVFSHREHYDGSGYPKGLAGKEIPILARIVSVADALDAIVSERPYKQKVVPNKALNEIQRNAGTQFDPDVVAALTMAYKEGKILAYNP